jgi:hypothetical protein
VLSRAGLVWVLVCLGSVALADDPPRDYCASRTKDPVRQEACKLLIRDALASAARGDIAASIAAVRALDELLVPRASPPACPPPPVCPAAPACPPQVTCPPPAECPVIADEQAPPPVKRVRKRTSRSLFDPFPSSTPPSVPSDPPSRKKRQARDMMDPFPTPN